MRDSSKHDSWQRQAVAADLAARAESVRQRRDEMAASQEAAIQARHNLVQQNLQAGHQLKVSNDVSSEAKLSVLQTCLVRISCASVLRACRVNHM